MTYIYEIWVLRIVFYGYNCQLMITIISYLKPKTVCKQMIIIK